MISREPAARRPPASAGVAALASRARNGRNARERRTRHGRSLGAVDSVAWTWPLRSPIFNDSHLFGLVAIRVNRQSLAEQLGRTGHGGLVDAKARQAGRRWSRRQAGVETSRVARRARARPAPSRCDCHTAPSETLAILAPGSARTSREHVVGEDSSPNSAGSATSPTDSRNLHLGPGGGSCRL